MKKRLRIFSIAYLPLLLSLFLMMESLAYLEPATVSYILQFVSFILITAGIAVGVFWKKIRLFFRNIKMKLLEKKLKNQADKNK